MANVNWVERVEAAMENCPSPEELEEEIKSGKNNLSLVELWLKRQAEEIKSG